MSMTNFTAADMPGGSVRRPVADAVTKSETPKKAAPKAVKPPKVEKVETPEATLVEASTAPETVEDEESVD